MTLRATLDMDALADNLQILRDLSGPRQAFIAALKADAYGHGAVPVATALEQLGVHSIATGSPAEAQAIREAGVETPILLFACAPPDATAELAARGFVTTVTSLDCAAAISDRVQEPVGIYIKVDVGLGRLGIPLNEAPTVIQRVAALARLRIDGLYTHAPFKDSAGAKWAQTRLDAFSLLLAQLAEDGLSIPITQARASGGVLAGLTDTCNAVCVGHALFGLSPFSTEDFSAVDRLRPVLGKLSTELIQVIDHGQGADIAIGGLYGIPRGKRIGVLPVGLGHGMARPGPGAQAHVLVRGILAPVLAVSLEHTTIDLDRVVGAGAGDPVVLLGRDGSECVTMDAFAGWNGESPIQSMMRLSGRASVEFEPQRIDRVGEATGHSQENGR